MKTKKSIKHRIKSHVKTHVKIYIPLLAILLVVIGPAIVVSAYDTYDYYDSTWDYSDSVWTPTTNTYNNSGSGSSGGNQGSTTTKTSGKVCSNVPTGAKEVVINKTNYSVSYYDTSAVIPEITGKSGVSYIYMKNEEGVADYGHIVGNVCKVLDGKNYGYIYPEKIEDAEEETVPQPTTTGEPAVVDPIPNNDTSSDVKETAIASPFPDVTVGTLESDAATDLYNRSVIKGYPDGEFKGNKSVNRAEATKMLLLAAEKVNVDTISTEVVYDGRFSDIPVSSTEWYPKYVMKAASEGIINGNSDGTFRPADGVNTAEFLKMISKTFELQENLEYSYTDVVSNDWFSKYTGVAEYYDLFPERLGKTLHPSQKLTREEVAVAIYKILLYFGK